MSALPVPPNQIQEAVERFLRLSVADGDARPRTVEAYRAGIAAYLIWAAGRGLDPLAATHEDVLAYRAFLATESGYKRATVRLRLVSVRLLYRAIQRWGGRRDNPADGVRAPRELEAASSAVLSRSVTPDQARAALAAAPAGRDGSLVRLMLSHGLRAGECSALTGEHLSPAGDRLTVPGKGGKPRTLVLSYRCRQDLSAARAGGDGYLFRRRGGGSLSVRSIERAVNRVLEAVGAKEPGKSAHSLRHGFGVLACLGGANPLAVGEHMGHADPKTTATYTRAAAQYMANPADAVERALSADFKP